MAPSRGSVRWSLNGRLQSFIGLGRAAGLGLTAQPRRHLVQGPGYLWMDSRPAILRASALAAGSGSPLCGVGRRIGRVAGALRERKAPASSLSPEAMSSRRTVTPLASLRCTHERGLGLLPTWSRGSSVSVLPHSTSPGGGATACRVLTSQSD